MIDAVCNLDMRIFELSSSQLKIEETPMTKVYAKPRPKGEPEGSDGRRRLLAPGVELRADSIHLSMKP